MGNMRADNGGHDDVQLAFAMRAATDRKHIEAALPSLSFMAGILAGQIYNRSIEDGNEAQTQPRQLAPVKLE